MGLRQLKIQEETHKQLNLYKYQNSLKNLDEAIKILLSKEEQDV
jgi:hypothetical protein